MKRCLIATLISSCLLLSPATTLANTTKPTITILATGGTIAGSSASVTDTTNYKAGTLTVDTLIQAVPKLNDLAHIAGEQVANIDSSNMDSVLLLKIGKRVNELLNDPKQDAIVITHGTDTIEETAFFLELTTNSYKPVVLVGAMRPATAISADGPLNLLEAVSLATDKQAQNRGTMVVMNDRIGSGFYIGKTNTIHPDAFKAPEQGYLGAFVGTQPKFYYTPAKPMDKPYFDISKIEKLPKVDILYGYQDQDGSLVDAAVNSGAKGIIIAGTGNGSVPDRMAKAINNAIDKGIPVVRSTRTGSGFVTPGTYLNSGIYNPQKARILLSLALAEEANVDQIRAYFDSDLQK